MSEVKMRFKSGRQRLRSGNQGTSGPRRRGHAPLVIASLLAALAIAACGSAGVSQSGNLAAKINASSGTGTTGSGSAAAGSAARQKFVNCLKQHGVTLPSRPSGAPPNGGYGQRFGDGNPGTGTGTTRVPDGGYPGRGRFFGGGAPNSKFAAAFKACAKYRPNFGNGGQGPGRFGRPRFSTKVLNQFVTCVRKNGFPQMPNPKATGNGGFFPSSIQNNAKFKAAAAKCQSILQKALSQARGSAPGSGGVAPGTSTTTAGKQA